jgi:hypothetical protein
MNHPRLFALLALGFIIATIAGTVSHELGHIAVAKSLGYDTTLHYGSMEDNLAEKWQPGAAYYKAHEAAIAAKPPSAEKEYFMAQRQAFGRHMFLITLGGPLQTMLTGTVGIVLLWSGRKKITGHGLTVGSWLFVFLAFFWSRQVFNCGIALLGLVLKGRAGGTGDEYNIDQYLGLPLMATNLITAAVALPLLLWVAFCIIPKPQRVTFIASGIAGSALGFWIWMYWLGPVVLN